MKQLKFHFKEQDTLDNLIRCVAIRTYNRLAITHIVDEARNTLANLPNTGNFNIYKLTDVNYSVHTITPINAHLTINCQHTQLTDIFINLANTISTLTRCNYTITSHHNGTFSFSFPCGITLTVNRWNKIDNLSGRIYFAPR